MNLILQLFSVDTDHSRLTLLRTLGQSSLRCQDLGYVSGCRSGSLYRGSPVLGEAYRWEGEHGLQPPQPEPLDFRPLAAGCDNCKCTASRLSGPGALW